MLTPHKQLVETIVHRSVNSRYVQSRICGTLCGLDIPSVDQVEYHRFKRSPQVFDKTESNTHTDVSLTI